MCPRTVGKFTITIEGVCHEAVDLGSTNGVTLQGAASGDGLSAPSAKTDPVLALSGRHVVFNRLTAPGSEPGRQFPNAPRNQPVG